ncbi:MAG: ATP-binding protein [Bryobacterales bacterium]|nr:ATP-binding protein [Bryobacterales bacterium]
MSRLIGRVLGTLDAQPLDFWVAAPPEATLQLDDVLMVRRALEDGRIVSLYGVVDQLIARHEGARLETDVFLAGQGIIPLGHAVKAHVTVTRVEPEIFVPPLPGEPVSLAAGADRDTALFFDVMKRKFPIGLTRDGEVAWGSFDFLDGSRGAHINISGVSGVATKTTYALFLLYGIFHSALLGADAANTRAVIFNVKGEDLLFLDKPNQALTPEAEIQYARMGLKPGPFASVNLFAPVRKSERLAIPDTGTRSEGVTGYCWSIEEFCRDRYLRFLFADADDETSHMSAVLDRVESHLARENVAGLETFDDLVALIGANLDAWTQSAAAGTRMAFLRRLEAAAARAGHLIRGDLDVPERHRIDLQRAQVTVIDIHNLHDRAKRFVVGAVLKRMFEDKEKSGRSRPLVFVVLDELNKYAPRDGWSPIKDVILDISERGRSLGVVLVGAQQTASQIERRVVSNCAFRVVGRLDQAEAQHGEYGFLPAPSRARAGILKPGSVIVAQPEIPVPLLVQFPFPAWATRPAEVRAAAGDPFELA